MRKISFRVVSECSCGSFLSVEKHGSGSSVFNSEAVVNDVVAVDVLNGQSVVVPDKVDSTGTANAVHVILHVDTGDTPVCLIVYELGGIGVRSYRSD